MSTIAIVFSTITGNAFRLAEAVAQVIPDHVGPYNIRYVDTIALLQHMKGKKIIIIGTLGAARESAHAQKVCENAENLVRAQNTLAGHFLCRGSIDLARTARRLRIPEGEKGHLSPERFEKQKESLGHPNAEELAQCQTEVKEFLKAL